VLVGVVVLVLALTSLGGGSSSSGKGATTSSSTGSAHARKTHTTTHGGGGASTEASSPAASPAETHVAVLNGTSTAGLAHRLSASLQQGGYSQATALNGTPPGSHQTTVVEYAGGYRADAQGVARTLEVAQVQPMEAAVASLVGGSTVAVIVGADKVPTVASGSGESSGGAATATP
jgi:hypothetical protein